MAGSTTLHRIVVITVCLVLMVLLHLVVAICAMLFRARRPSRRVAEEERGGGAGLTAEELGQLPCHEFKEGVGSAGAGGGECAVCLDVFRSGDRCRVLPRCGHGFHADCLDSWLRKSRRCPVCRTEAVQQHKDGPVAAAVEVVSEV